MCKLTVKYSNADGLFRFDEAIREAMRKWRGAEIGSGQNLETHTRDVTYAFEDEGDDSAALQDLNEILEDRVGEDEAVYARQAAESSATHQVVILDRPKTAQEVFGRYSRRLGWDFPSKADVLLNWLGEDVIEVLLEQIQDAGQAEDFEEFLADNFGEDVAREDSPIVSIGVDRN